MIMRDSRGTGKFILGALVGAGVALLFAGISEILFNALDATGVDPSTWFIPDGDTGDIPLLTDGGFDTGEFDAGIPDTGDYAGDAPFIDYDVDTGDNSLMTDGGNYNNITFDASETSYYEDKLKKANKDIDYYSKELTRINTTDTYKKNCQFSLEQAIKKSKEYARKIDQLRKS